MLQRWDAMLARWGIMLQVVGHYASSGRYMLGVGHYASNDGIGA